MGTNPDQRSEPSADSSGQLTKYVNTDKAAVRLGYSPRYLETMRRTGEGPPFVTAGKRRTYDITDLDAWAAARKRRSTSEAA